jgi:hypothetical protein
MGVYQATDTITAMGLRVTARVMGLVPDHRTTLLDALANISI